MYKYGIFDHNNIEDEGQSCVDAEFLYTIKTKLELIQTNFLINLRCQL